MAARRKSEASLDFERGVRELTRHRPDLALRLFREAVDSCPAGKTSLLEKRLYWLSIALLRLDQPELALKSLASARKIKPRGHSAKLFARRVNEYGMTRRSCSDLDDFYAFFSVQTCLFLASRAAKRFSCDEEKDTVTRLIAFAWQELKKSGRLADKRSKERLALFRDWPKVFPSFMSGSGHIPRPMTGASRCEGKVVNFRRVDRCEGGESKA